MTSTVETGGADAGNGPTEPRVGAKALDGLENSYKELLDATKHQDDKIGRIFTGVAFLTAAALAMANLNSASFLVRQYTDMPNVPLAVVSLGAYLVLVLICVTLLLSSLATPLRVPGLEDKTTAKPYRPEWIAGVRASQIYFGHIARLSLSDWNRKWVAANDKELSEKELAQSLVLETHNLANRTQFKYNRTTEAVVLFKFALMFLSMTVVLCIAASLTPQPSPLPVATKWAVGGAVGAYIFFHLQEQIRYSRQTIDELKGRTNTIIAILRYGWGLAASAWAVLAAVGGFQRTLVILVIVGTILLVASTALERQRNELNAGDDWVHWLIPIVVLVLGMALSFVGNLGSYYWALGTAVSGASAITIFAFFLPTLRTYRDVSKH